MSLTKLNPSHLSAEYRTRRFSRFPIINSVIEGSQEGLAVGNEVGEVFTLHKAGFGYVKAAADSDFVRHLVEFVRSSNNLPNYFHIYAASLSLQTEFENHADEFGVKTRKRIQLQKLDAAKSVHQVSVPSEFRISQIDSFNFESLEILGLDIANKFWRSKEHFLDNGFGVCILSGASNPVAVCYTAAVDRSVAEIDIKTDSKHQRKGLGELAVNKFVQICLAKGITANWDCFEDNIASVKTALKAGFEITYEYPFLSVFSKKKTI